MNEFTLLIRDAAEPPPQHLQINITRLATQMGYSPSHLSRVLAHKTTPSLRCVQKIATTLQLNINDLCKMLEEGRISATKTN